MGADTALERARGARCRGVQVRMQRGMQLSGASRRPRMVFHYRTGPVLLPREQAVPWMVSRATRGQRRERTSALRWRHRAIKSVDDQPRRHPRRRLDRRAARRDAARCAVPARAGCRGPDRAHAEAGREAVGQREASRFGREVQRRAVREHIPLVLVALATLCSCAPQSRAEVRTQASEYFQCPESLVRVFQAGASGRQRRQIYSVYGCRQHAIYLCVGADSDAKTNCHRDDDPDDVPSGWP